MGFIEGKMSFKMPFKILLALAVGLTLLSCSLSGFDLAFTTYALTLKDTYNFTQTQVEVAASFSAFGMGVCFMEVIINAWLGYKFLFAFTWVVFPGASLFLSISSGYSSFFHENPAPIFIALFLMSTASMWSLMSSTSIIVSVLSSEHTGKFIGAYCAMLSFGKLSYGFLVQVFFSDNLAGFFRTISVASFILYTCTYVVLHCLQLNIQKADNISYEIMGNDKGTEDVSPEQEHRPTSLREMMTSVFFHLVFWSTLITYSCTLTLMNNVTSIGESVGVIEPMILVYIMSLVALLARLLVGYINDRFFSVPVSLALVIVTNVVLCLSYLLGMFHLTMSSMYVFSLCLGVALGGGYTIVVPLFALKFGKTHYRFLTGIFFALISVFMFGIQVVVGAWYDSKAIPNHKKENLCLGSVCYYETFLLMFVATCICILCITLIFFQETIHNVERFSLKPLHCCRCVLCHKT